MQRCQNCGHENDPSAVFCLSCGKPLGKRPNWWKRRSGAMKALIIVGAIVIVGAIAGGAGASGSSPTTTEQVAVTTTERATTTTQAQTTTTRAETTTTTLPATTTTTEPPTTTTTESAVAFKESCEQIEFKVLDKNPDAHLGERLRFTGEIVQIMENDGVTVMRVNVTKTRYGYDDTIWVEYPGSVDVYEEDVVWIWGVCFGKFSYTSTIGAEISLPGLFAKFVEKAS